MTKRQWLSACLHDPRGSVRSETAYALRGFAATVDAFADRIEGLTGEHEILLAGSSQMTAEQLFYHKRRVEMVVRDLFSDL